MQVDNKRSQTMRNLRSIQRLPFGGALLVVLLGACEELPTDALRLLSVQIEAPDVSLQAGHTLRFGVTATTPAGSKLELVGLNWSSSQPQIAEVVDGRVSGHLPGTTFIRAYISGIADSVLVTVRPESDGESAQNAAASGGAPTNGCSGSSPFRLRPSVTC